MYGRLRGPELPIYGAKTLAVQDGRLELHGKSWMLFKYFPPTHTLTNTIHCLLRYLFNILCIAGSPTPTTWTLLSETVEIGSTEINLQVPVNWNVGDFVVIASTGDKQSQKENEKRHITAISDNQQRLSLDEPLEYQHLGITGGLVDMAMFIKCIKHVIFDS